MAEPFRRCRVCGAQWHSLEHFLADPSLRLVGLQAVPKVPTASALVFNHNRCGTISIKTSLLRELLDMPGPAAGEDEPCEGCFRDLDELAACRKACTIACDRRLTGEIQRRKGG